MRTEILQALILLAGLQAAGPLLSPTTIEPHELVHHLGEHVTLKGRVSDIEPGDPITQVTLTTPNGSATVLTRTQPPPLGAQTHITGDAAPGREGPVLWANGPWTVQATPDPAPLALAQLTHHAPERVDTTVAVKAAWNPETQTLTDRDNHIRARILTQAPDPGDAVLAWGLLEYDTEHSAYRLDVTGWKPWPTSTPP